MDLYYTVIVYVLTGIVGVCVGSFLNVVIYRLPNGMSLAKPSSHCPKCGYVLKWYDNIPVLSYCILGGKCRSCKEPISFRYTAVELANMILWLACVALFWDLHDLTTIPYTVGAALCCTFLICVFFIDLERMIIFDRFQILLGVTGLIMLFFDPSFLTLKAALFSHLIGAFVGGFVFFAIYFVMTKLLKKEAMGGGDIKLAFVSGLILGWEKLILAMLIASVSACLIMIPLMKKQEREALAKEEAQTEKLEGEETQTTDTQRIETSDEEAEGEAEEDESGQFPFGPFIAVGLVVAMLFGSAILQWYFGLFL